MKTSLIKCMALLLTAVLALGAFVACEAPASTTNQNNAGNNADTNSNETVAEMKSDVVEADLPNVSKPTLYVSNLTVKPGTKTVDVKIYVLGNPGIAGLMPSLQYPESMKLQSYSYDPAFTGQTDVTTEYSNPQLFNWINPNDNNTTNGVFVTATFDISGVDTAAGALELKLTYSADDTVNKELQNVSFDVINGKITFAN